MSSNFEYNSVFTVPIRSLEYHDMAVSALGGGLLKSGAADRATDEVAKQRSEVQLTEAELQELIRRERADAALQVEQRLRQEYDLKLEAARKPIAVALTDFAAKRTEYFTRVEAEIVHLSLAVAAKILHREAQVDPMLVATLVRMAVQKMREGSNVTVRIGRGRGAKWQEFFAVQPMLARVEVLEDAELSDHDCVLETEQGIANFGLDTQLKEIEKGFFDLMALRPVNG
jgi:flagellar assembly protein FliH